MKAEKIKLMHEIAVKKARSRHISTTGKGGYERHVLFCGGKSCCDGENYNDVWKHLNKRLKALEKEGHYVYRTRVDCLNFCRSGPLLVVYPEGIWYHSVTLKTLEKIIDQHLIGDKIVTEFAFAKNPMKEPLR